MKKLLRFLLLFILSGLFLGLGGFLALALYYRNNFPVNTWINGVYCTGKTVEQVNAELVGAQETSVIYVVDADSESWEIDMQEAGIRADYTAELKSYLKQNAFAFWLDNLHNPASYEIASHGYAVDEERLWECFAGLSFVAQEQTRPQGAAVSLSAEGYIFRDGNAGRLNTEKAYSYLKSCLAGGETTVRLVEGECYEDVPDSAADSIQRRIWKQICDFTDRCGRIVYDMGEETIALTPDIACRFLEKGSGNGIPALDGQGNIMISEAGVYEWLEELASDYDTCDTEKEFAATRGETVTVRYVTYGTKLDVDAEKEYLMEALRMGAGVREAHIPTYIQQGYVRGLDDIGGTYVEVDLTEQKLYYYVDGEIALETAVVTGNLARKTGTPEGINFVYNKQRNRTLRGPGYSSFVKYWMPVKGGIGLHDASWRSKFGGEIYKTNGSHGCINMSTEIAAQLYDMIEIGTPVIMFY